jgi:membrane fusion protein (multidrug efflux system)
MKLTADRTGRAAALVVMATGTLFLAVISSCSKEEQVAAAPTEVRVMEVVQRDVPVFREWVGQTFGAEDIEIRARVDGWLQGLHFREGSEVRKGTLLYTIDQNELQQRVAAAESRLAEAKTLLVQAEADVARYNPLAAAGAVSQRDLEIAVAQRDARASEVEAAKAGVELAQIELGYATMRAPIDGLIGISAARVGDFVGRPPNAVILNTISRVDSIRVRFSITEQEYLDLVERPRTASTEAADRPRPGLEMVLADGSVYPERGFVLFTERRIDPATGTLLVEASFPNPQRILRPGQFARVRAVFEVRKGAVVVPVRAISELQGQPVVFTVNAENKVEFRRLVAGPVVGDIRVIEKGVAVGEKVIVEGTQKVRPDMIVAPTTVPWQSPGASGPPGTVPGGATDRTPAGAPDSAREKTQSETQGDAMEGQ